MAAGYTFVLFSILTITVMCSQFDRFAIREREVTTSTSCHRGENRRVHPRPSQRRTNRGALLSRPCTTLEYTTPYFGTGAGRFIYFVCMCCAARVPRDEGDETGRECKRGWRRMIPVRNGVDERAFRVWSLDSPLHAAFKLYFSLSPKITFVRYSISPRDGEAPGKMTGMVSGEFSQAPYIAIKSIRKIMRNRNTMQPKKFFNMGAHCDFFLFEEKAIGIGN